MNNSLVHDIWIADKTNKMLRYGIITVLGSLLLTLSAKIAIPFYPVPFTMQTLVVLGMGMVCGPRLAGAIIALYLAQGAFGLPVFNGTPEKGIGLAYMMGPTGGYLLGFFVASILCGYLATRNWDKSYLKTMAAMILGNVIIYSLGVAWLGTLLGWDKPILQWGFLNFVLSDIAKIAIAAAIIPTASKLLKR